MLTQFPPPQPRDTGAAIRRMIALLAAALVLVAGMAARADEIRLRREAASRGADAVILRDVAELRGPRAEALGDTPVLRWTAAQDGGRVTLEGLRTTLDAAGANWALVSLRGYTSCKVHRNEADSSAISRPAAPGIDAAAGVSAMPIPREARDTATNPEHAIDIASSASVKSLVLDRLAELAAAAPQDLRVTFSERDEARLSRGTLSDRFEITPTSRNTLGRVPLTIHRFRGDELAETMSVAADVERRMLAVVATSTLGRGDPITRDHVEVREVWQRDDAAATLSDPKLVIGQTSKALLRPGTPVLAEHLEQPTLVARGELVTVRCLVGGLVIRTVGRASEAGAMDQTILVRNEATRETFHATVTGPREAMVRLDAAAPATPGATP